MRRYTCSGMKVHHLSEISTSRAHRIDASACGLSNALPISKSEPYIALTCLTCPPIQASNNKPLNLRNREVSVGGSQESEQDGTVYGGRMWQGQHHTPKMNNSLRQPYGNPTGTLRNCRISSTKCHCKHTYVLWGLI